MKNSVRCRLLPSLGSVCCVLLRSRFGSALTSPHKRKATYWEASWRSA